MLLDQRNRRSMTSACRRVNNLRPYRIRCLARALESEESKPTDVCKGRRVLSIVKVALKSPCSPVGSTDSFSLISTLLHRMPELVAEAEAFTSRENQDSGCELLMNKPRAACHQKKEFENRPLGR